MHFLKKIIMLAVIITVGYFILGYHYIVIDNSIKPLKKSQYTLQYTFFSTKAKTTEAILSNKVLWNDGIGNLLVKEGKITEEELEAYKESLEETE
jgi:hypothetical protein